MSTQTDPDEENRFRDEIRDWLRESVPEELRTAADLESLIRRDRLIAERGFLGYSWPREYGGHDGSALQSLIIDEELTAAGIPTMVQPSRNGFRNLGPTLLAHGTEEQKQRFLPRIRSVQDIWCQGFSEPEAGSDLASVSTYAVRDGQNYRIHGTKVWTTHGHYADWCYVLAKTAKEAPRHHNLSFFLVPMKQPGVHVTPIRQITGEAEFNQVYFDGAVTPAENIVGELNQGWQVALTTLSTERASGIVSQYRVYSDQVRELLRMVDDSSLPTLGRLYSKVLGVKALASKIKEDARQGAISDPALSSGGKLFSTELQQEITEAGLMAAIAAGRDVPVWNRRFLASRAVTIYGGTSQIQRNILAERVLGLPR